MTGHLVTVAASTVLGGVLLAVFGEKAEPCGCTALVVSGAMALVLMGLLLLAGSG